ncbi:MAG: NYN domain-containing protein [Acidimicrobiales bacterium]
MRWLVDGMNLIGSRPDGWWRDRAGARRRTVDQLAAFGRRPDVEGVAVVFDGHDRADEVAGGRAAGVDVSFAPGGPDAADRVIAAIAGRAVDPAGITVVTSDAGLVSQVRSAGVKVMGAAAFRRLMDQAPA